MNERTQAKTYFGHLVNAYAAMDRIARYGYNLSVIRNLVDTDRDTRVHGKLQAEAILAVERIEREEQAREVRKASDLDS